ncbi:MAG: N-acetylmuramoyl-L-alanine amidase [Gammaproteobacteria bacterium]|nr:N-acetylmuramoyl-L-alanine amidase [Gammaproteobacteria bacterium]
MSQSGATSETARWLAEKENRADLIGGAGGVSLGDKDDLLAGVLLDLSMTASLSASLDMGQRVLNAIKPINQLHKRQVEQAAFSVLKSPDVPSLLIETGFISNPPEARKLGSKTHQRAMAKAIFYGVRALPRRTSAGWLLTLLGKNTARMRH